MTNYDWDGYITAELFTSDYGQPDCNVTKGKTLLVKVNGGHISEEEAAKRVQDGEAVILEVGSISFGGNTSYHMKPAGHKGHLMFGGTFAWTSDSRGRAIMKQPMPIHDRFEG